MSADHNKMTRHEFLRRILQSGEVTKIAQHLALAIVILADDCQFKASVRDLERMTGWSKTMIADHLAELEVFMNVTLGVGRGKTVFELQGVIEDAINKAVVSASRTLNPTVAQSTVRQPDAIADTTPDTSSFVPFADAIADMSACRTLKTEPEKRAGITTRATKESPSEIVNPSGSGEKFTPAPAGQKHKPSPHMNGVGFVISQQHDLIIPAKTVTRWRSRFPDLPDLEAAMERLATTLLHRGITHPGWTCPEGWMAGILSDMNQEASNKNRVAEAKVTSTQRNQPTKTFRR